MGAVPIKSEPPAVTRPLLSGSVLLIMQDAEIRGLLRFGLKHQGFEVYEAATGAEGLEIVRSGRVTSVLLDMDVADTSGLSLIGRLREISPLPILALAGRVNATGVVDALDRGANDFAPRPFNIEEISARLRAAFRFPMRNCFVPAA
jgi:two-component system KDP operon response regulator KdpE